MYIEKRRQLDPVEKAEMDMRMCERFMSLVTYRYAGTILLYAPKSIEIDVMPIAEAALASGRNVAFPRCYDNDEGIHLMSFHIVRSLDELEPGAYGIREPSQSLPLYDPKDSKNDVIIVPALAYDRQGYRLGYGGGYYDRFLAGFSGTKAGFAYSRSISPKLPRSRYDLPVDVIVTERRVTAIERRP